MTDRALDGTPAKSLCGQPGDDHQEARDERHRAGIGQWKHHPVSVPTDLMRRVGLEPDRECGFSAFTKFVTAGSPPCAAADPSA